ncbi:MAG: hypothetical protein GY749_03080 [Desulfobacteraceae bacterium]|nr:hypothetical protein [Desulfobacteraceae bacterium]
MEERNAVTIRNSEETKILPKYEPPRIITYTEEEILEQVGPAQACSPSPGDWADGF